MKELSGKIYEELASILTELPTDATHTCASCKWYTVKCSFHSDNLLCRGNIDRVLSLILPSLLVRQQKHDDEVKQACGATIDRIKELAEARQQDAVEAKDRQITELQRIVDSLMQSGTEAVEQARKEEREAIRGVEN